MEPLDSFLRNLARVLLAGPWTARSLEARSIRMIGGRRPWLRPLVRRLHAAFRNSRESLDEDRLTAFLAAEPEFRPGQPATWVLPNLPTTAALAAWLAISPPHLEWFADAQGRSALNPTGPLRHYTYHWIKKRSGRLRLLEIPKARLKVIQRKILDGILSHIPPHDAAHGFRRGHSIVSYAAPHTHKEIVLRFDLCHFFPSVSASRVHALFHTAGYPLDVVRLLTGLCTSVVPTDVWRSRPASNRAPDVAEQRIYRGRHLPQGAPTSPALANLAAFRLDCRLAGLARRVEADYTRYADDLAFSGGATLERAARRFQVEVCRIVLEEGFEVRTRKSRFMRRGVRQQLAGIVVNEHPNVGRAEFDLLKAILHNCARHGPVSQNRDARADFRAHLMGRIAHVAAINPAKGQRLKRLFDQVSWQE